MKTCDHRWIVCAVVRPAFDFMCETCNTHIEATWLTKFAGKGFLDICDLFTEENGGRIVGIENGQGNIDYMHIHTRNCGKTWVSDPLPGDTSAT